MSEHPPAVTVNPGGGSGGAEGRDGWATPLWLAEIIGSVYLDPCSNPRSHILARNTCSLETGGNGLFVCEKGVLTGPGWWSELDPEYEILYSQAWADHTVYVNPPYARGQVIRWVRHYRHTRFIFLLRWDPSTDWFSELHPHCTHVWFPDQRINFEPPPGVKSSSNPFPHALFMRDPSEELLTRLRGAGYTFRIDGGGPPGQSGPHGHQRPGGEGSAVTIGRGAETDPGPGGAGDYPCHCVPNDDCCSVCDPYW